MRILIIFILTAVIFSCQNNSGDETVDLLHVVREGASIPAYVYGNTDSETFIIILHGGPGGNGFEYKTGFLSDELERFYGVVYTDQRGQGMSQSTSNAPVNSLELMTEDVYALALTLRAKYGDNINLFLMGHSWGGLLGTSVMVNENFSREFKGWIEVAGAHDFPAVYTSGHFMIDSICNNMISQDISEDIYSEFLERLSSVNINEITLANFSVINALAFEVETQLLFDGVLQMGAAENLVDQLRYQFLVNNYITSTTSGNTTNAELFANDLFEVNLTSQLSNITTPTLLMWGAFDLVVPFKLGETAFQEINTDDKEFIIFDLSGHSPFNNQTIEFTEEIIDFVEAFK